MNRSTLPSTRLCVALAAIVLFAVFAAPLAAQEMPNLPASQLGGQSLRPYWHVFIAYAIALGVMLVWVISIARRLSGIEARISETS